MKNKLENTGITLISLVVTIIVLLILAGVTLSLIGGSEGILGRSTHAVDENEKAMAKEQVELAVSDYQTEFYEAKYVDRTNDGTKKEYILEKLKGETYTEKYRVVTSEEGKVKVYEKNGVSKNPIVTGNVQEDGSIKWDDEIAVGSPEEGETEEKNEAIMINVAEPNISSDYVKATVHAQIEYEGTITEITINGEKVEATKGENGIYTIEKEFTENGEYKIIAKDEDGKVQIEIAKITELTEDMDIWNKADMECFRDKVNSGRTFEGRTARVMADIDLEGSSTNQWIPVGMNEKEFKGIFEGNDYTIDNLYINSSSDYQALFAYNYGIIKNVKLKNGTINAKNYIASLVSMNYGEVIRCSNLKVQVCGSNIKGHANIGGLIAVNDNIVKECYNDATVILEYVDVESIVGGVVGLNRKDLYSCYNSGEIKGVYSTNNVNFNIGGVVGYIREPGKAEGLYNTGKVIGEKIGTANSYTLRIGGVCGTVYLQEAALSYAYNIGSVTGMITPTTQLEQGSVLGNIGRGKAQYLYSNGSKVVGIVAENGTATECYTSIPETINEEYFVKDENGINGGYPILKWQLEK